MDLPSPRRHRSGAYRCGVHGSATRPPCRHIADTILAADHLDNEDATHQETP